jgi:hypothetical protein
MENLSLLTYTHSKCEDLHKIYFDRIKKFFPELFHNFVTSNKYVPYGTFIEYDDEKNHSEQMINAINKIPTDYLIYSQEDYILFDRVKVEELYNAIKILDNDKNIGFIRLIHSGLGFDKNKVYDENYAYIDKLSEYFYSTQITIWKKNVLKNMFDLSKIKTIFDEPKNSPFLRNLNIDGLYEIKHGNAVGNHYNSYTYPYIATAKVKGKWNLIEYPNEITQLFEEYNIN